VDPVKRGVEHQAQQLRGKQECGWVMAHKKTPTQEGDVLIVHGRRVRSWNSL
jgi:hypothetical protein